jgi:hypothetical protein
LRPFVVVMRQSQVGRDGQGVCHDIFLALSSMCWAVEP